MADKKISQLDPMVSQNNTDLYEFSANGAGSYRETRAQQLSYYNSNLTNPSNEVFAAKNGDNTTGTGKFNNPYADPFHATSVTTGSTTTRPTVLTAPGTYSITEYLIRANVGLNGYGRYSTFIDPSSVIELYNDWSGEPVGSITPLYNANFDFGVNLDFSSAPNGCALFLENSIFAGDFNATTSAGHSAVILSFGCEFGGVGMSSVSGTHIADNIKGNIGLTSSGGGAATSTFAGCLMSSSSTVTISGTSGNLQTGKFIASPIINTLTLDGIYGRLQTDAISIPAAGITYANGADKSQVTLLGNAPAKCLNNAYTGQNGNTPVAITSTSNSIAWDADVAPNAFHQATEDSTLANPTNGINGFTIALCYKQHASAAKTLAFGSKFRFPGGVTPTVSTVLGSRNWFYCTYNSADDVWDTTYDLGYPA